MMKFSFILRLAMTGLVSFGMVTPQIAIAAPSPAGVAAGAGAATPLVTEVKKKGKWSGRGLKNPHWKGNKKWKGKNWKNNKNWKKGGKYYRGGPRGVYVRSWKRRPYYGNVIGGVALGTILGVAIAGSVPRAASPDLCWYWTNPARTHGYWDYCY